MNIHTGSSADGTLLMHDRLTHIHTYTHTHMNTYITHTHTYTYLLTRIHTRTHQHTDSRKMEHIHALSPEDVFPYIHTLHTYIHAYIHKTHA